jgi:hypothetical protein
VLRSIFATLAAAWFGLQAITFTAPGVFDNSGQGVGMDGDPAAVAVTSAARAVSAGLALVALALIEWDLKPAATTPPSAE